MACRARERVWRCWCSASTSTASAKSPCRRTRLLPSCSSCSRRWPISPARTTSRAPSRPQAPTTSASRLRVLPPLPRQRRRPGRWHPPRTSVHVSPSSPTRIRRSIGGPASTARRGSCAARHGVTSSRCRCKAFPWSRSRATGARPRRSFRAATPDPPPPAVRPPPGAAALIDHAAAAAKLGRFEQVLGVIAGVLRVEEKIPETSGVRRQYAIALRRFYTKPVLEGLSRLLGAPKHRAAAVAALQRGGAAGVEVLMDVLAAAPTVGERRAVFDALKHMTEGTDQLVHMLDHSAWFVVRNVAELIGELGMEDAVPALGKCLDHADERVRKAVGLALAKIGTRGAAEPLRRALRDRSQEVRLQVAVGIGGRKSSALAMPLVVAMEEEKDEAVVRELILALGRIGSPD